MPTPHDDALRIESRAPAIYSHAACPDAELQQRIDPDEWPALRDVRAADARSPVPVPPVTMRADSALSSTPSSDTAAPAPKSVAAHHEHKIDLASSPAPSGDTESSKETRPARSTPDPAGVYLSRDPNSSASAYPGFLPPPPRPLYTSSFLRPGSRFVGKQQSDKQVYKVEVTFKSVDIKESFLCGYLRIEGLTKDHPTLTTYFEGEIIGSKYTFQTKHEAWGATEKTDMQHWNRFPAWRPLANQAKRPEFHYKNFMEKENIFMRWKEYFLVPDHRVREIHGASFEGFYYICFNQVKGTVSGIYFHAKSEKFQQLELEFVHDMGGFAAIEFR